MCLMAWDGADKGTLTANPAVKATGFYIGDGKAPDNFCGVGFVVPKNGDLYRICLTGQTA